jgi:hypothetical protein
MPKVLEDMKEITRALTIAVLAAGITAGGAFAASGPVPVPQNGAYLGIFVKMGPDMSARMAGIESLIASTTGTKRVLALHLHFASPRSLEYVERAPGIMDDFAKGRTPVITLKCTASLESIASGALDSQFASIARGLARLPGPVMLRWFHEFNLNLEQEPVNLQNRGCFDAYNPARSRAANEDAEAQEFIAAWRHIHGIFMANGATNVSWIWCPAATPVNLRRHDVMKFFPGRAYVDWIGGDFYDRKGQGFAAVATPFYSMMHAAFPDMPIIVDETNEEAASAPPFDQARYMEDIAADLPTMFPQIKAVIIFDARGGGANDFILSPNGLAAFAKLAANPYFRPMP